MKKIIIGIDPGTRKTGYGVVQYDGTHYIALDYGCIRPPASYKLSDKYLVIYESVLMLIEQFDIEIAVMETQFSSKRNPQTGIKLGMARGSAVIAARKKKLPIYEYPPTQAKLASVGYGHASKEQVQDMIRKQFNLPKPPPPDAADALALTLCYIFSFNNKQLLKEL